MIALDPERLPSPNEVVADKYRVVRVIAEGGMGVVLEAFQDRLDRAVALKILHPHVRADKEIATRFEREARAAARLTGPHVVRVLDVDNLEDGSPVMVMELLTGRDLAAELQRRGPLPVQEAVGYVLQACAAMAEAHRLGIVHRDLKPANLFLQDDATGRRLVKVLDFGISKLMSIQDVAMTSTQSMLGTPLYMSPEQVRSAKNVDARTDVWSLGIILYELLSGVPPFQGKSATAVAAAIVADDPPRLDRTRKDLPKGLMAAIMKSLAKEPDDRFPDVEAFAAAIGRFGPSELPASSGMRLSAADLLPFSPQDSVGGAFDDTALAKSAPGASTTLRRSQMPWALVVLSVGVVGAATFWFTRPRADNVADVASSTASRAPLTSSIDSAVAQASPSSFESAAQDADVVLAAPPASSQPAVPATTTLRAVPPHRAAGTGAVAPPPPTSASPTPPPTATTTQPVNPLHL